MEYTAAAMRGRYNKDGQVEQNIEVSDREYANAVTTVQKDSLVSDSLRIRKLIPKECFRLQGFDDSDFNKAEAVNSNTQLYKQAGNSICVPVLEYIIKALIDCLALEKERGKEMELKIYNPTEDGFIKAIEWNHEEIKKEVSEKVEYYKNLVYTDDQIKEAKADRATLRKFVDALETKRKEIKKQCLAPYEDFEKQMKEIVAIVNEPVALIDSQVKGYEEKQKQEKLDSITDFYNSTEHPEWLHLSKIMNEKWLNASTSMKSVQDSIIVGLEKVNADIETLSNLPEFGFEATELYKSTLDVNKAINEAHRMAEMAKAKAAHEAEMKARAEEQARLAAEAEAKKQDETAIIKDTDGSVYVQDDDKQGWTKHEAPSEPTKQWVKFQALLSTEDALALKQFFKDRNIEFEAI